MVVHGRYGDIVNITGRDKILLHLMNQQEFKDSKGEVPYRICQRGIAEYVSLSRNRVSELLRDLVQKEKLEEITKRVVGLERRRKVYFLTDQGRKRANELRDELKEKKVAVKVGEEDDRRKVKLENIDKFIETGDPLLSALNRMEDDVIDLTEEEEEREDVFVGRQEEMKYLNKVLKKVKDQGSSTVFVTGPAGIGKTSLVSEFKQKAAEEGFEFLSGNALYESAEPYRPLRSALERYETLASMFKPEEIPGKKEVRDKETFDAERHAEWYEISQKMKEIAAERPFVVFLDDLQWSDRATLELLHYLSAELDDPRVLFIGAYRPEDLDGDHPMQECKDRMIRENLFDELELAPLNWEDTKKIVKNQLGRKDIPDEFVKLVHQTTEGNPLFIRESVIQMLEDRTIKPKKNEYPTSRDAIEIPDVVEAVIQRRVKRLSEDTEKVLSKAGIIGEKVPFQLLHKVTGLNEVELLDHLDVLVDTELFQDDPKEEVFSFSHTLIHLAVYEDIPTRVREGYHRVVGEKMVELYHNELESKYSDLGYHYERGGDLREALDYYRRAGEEAKSVYAHEDAIKMYKKVLKLFEKVGSKELTEVEILEEVGDTYKIIGEYEKAKSSFEEAVDKSTENSKKQMFYRKIGTVLKEEGNYDDAMSFIEKGLSISEENVERCRSLGAKGNVLMRRGEFDKAAEVFNKERDVAEGSGYLEGQARALHDLGTLHLKKGNYDESEDQLKKAVDIWEDIEDLQGLGDSLHSLASNYFYKGETNKALTHLEQSLDIREKIGDKIGMASSLSNIGTIYDHKGEIDSALKYHEQVLNISEEVGDGRGMAVSLNNIGKINIHKGKLDEALDYCQRSLEISEKIEAKERLTTSLNYLGDIYEYKGELDKALRYYERGLTISEDIGEKRGIAVSLFHLGTVHASKGELDEALESLQESMDLADKIGEKNLLAPIRCRLTEVWLKKDELDKADKTSKKALGLADELGSNWEKGMSHMFRGMVYKRERRWQESEEELSKSIETLKEADYQGELARAEYEFGSMWKAKGDEKKAKEWLEEALSMFKEMGMQIWIDKAKEEFALLAG